MRCVKCVFFGRPTRMRYWTAYMPACWMLMIHGALEQMAGNSDPWLLLEMGKEIKHRLASALVPR